MELSGTWSLYERLRYFRALRSRYGEGCFRAKRLVRAEAICPKCQERVDLLKQEEDRNYYTCGCGCLSWDSADWVYCEGRPQFFHEYEDGTSVPFDFSAIAERLD